MTDEELYEIGVKAYGNELRKNERKGYGPYVTAVILAIRPIIERETRERCAKIAEELDAIEFEEAHRQYGEGYFDAVSDIAAAIRSDGDE